MTFTTRGPAPDTTSPTLTGITPSEAAVGVPREGAIKLNFSEPMNRASVERAFSLISPIASSAGTFSWNTDSTEVIFDPNTDFPYGSTVEWRLSPEGTDLAGNPLTTSTTHTFQTIRSSTVTLALEAGNVGLIYDTTEFSGENPWTIGDNSQNKAFRAATSFVLSEIDSNTTRITEAILTWPHFDPCSGDPTCDPFVSLGAFMIESVHYGTSLSPADAWSTPRFGTPLLLSSSIDLNIESGNCRVPVTSKVSDAWNNRSTRSGRAQFRLRFETSTDDDNASDSLMINSSGLSLKVTYEHP